MCYHQERQSIFWELTKVSQREDIILLTEWDAWGNLICSNQEHSKTEVRDPKAKGLAMESQLQEIYYILCHTISSKLQGQAELQGEPLRDCLIFSTKT